VLTSAANRRIDNYLPTVCALGSDIAKYLEPWDRSRNSIQVFPTAVGEPQRKNATANSFYQQNQYATTKGFINKIRILQQVMLQTTNQ